MNDGVKQWLNTLVLKCRPAQHRIEGHITGAATHQRTQFLNAWLETGWQIRPGADSSAVVRRHFKVSESQAEIGLRFDIGDSFNVEVVAVEEARAQGAGGLTDDIMLMLSTHGPQTANEIGAKMGKKPFSIRRRLQKLEEKGMVNKEGSKWSQI